MISYSDQDWNGPARLFGMCYRPMNASSKIHRHTFCRKPGDHGVEIGVWPFIEPANYWAIQFDLVEQVKAAFDQAGITVPFPDSAICMCAAVLSVKSETMAS